MMLPATKTVLLVEDSPDDIFFFKRRFREASLTHRIVTISDGPDALRYFRGEAQYSDRSQFPIPMVMFLDLKLPHVNGFDVLQTVRQIYDRAQLLIVVLTGGGESANVHRAYALGADSFIIKPPRQEDFRNLVASFPSHF